MKIFNIGYVMNMSITHTVQNQILFLRKMLSPLEAAKATMFVVHIKLFIKFIYIVTCANL